MAKVTLSLETLGDLDGGMARAMIDKEIAHAVADLDDRGEDAKPRHVLIDLVLEQDKKTGAAVVTVAAQAKLPPRRSGGTVAEQKRSGKSDFQLMFQSMNPERPDQSFLPSMDGEEDAE